MKLVLGKKKEEITLVTPEGTEEECYLEEMTGKQRDQYLTQMSNNVKHGPDGKASGLKTFEGSQSSLIVRTLHKPSGELFKETEIQEFSGTALNALFEKCQKINGLDKESIEEIKNG